MRADRLVSLLMLLQRRGKVTAAEVADELEVSVRTARRDLEALGMAGLPVYSEPGRNGGWKLLGDARTDLTGLSVDEAVAVFSAIGAVPATAEAVGSRSAMRKLINALPDPMRDQAERAAKTIRVQPSLRARNMATPQADTIDRVRASIVNGQKASLGYRDRTGQTSQRLIDPWGLVVNDGDWYLIAGTERGRRTFRVDRILDYRLLDEPVDVPDGFDLDLAWGEVESAIDELRHSTSAMVTIAPDYLRQANHALGDRLVLDEPDGDESDAVGRANSDDAVNAVVGDREDGRIGATVRGWSIEELAAVLAGLHPGVNVTGPDELIRYLAGLGRQLADDHRRQ